MDSNIRIEMCGYRINFLNLIRDTRKIFFFKTNFLHLIKPCEQQFTERFFREYTLCFNQKRPGSNKRFSAL